MGMKFSIWTDFVTLLLIGEMLCYNLGDPS